MKNNPLKIVSLLFVFSLVMVPNCYANAGTPLMWLGMLHLFAGNAIIGIVEGLIIAKKFSIRKRVAIFTMILANYLSMILGQFLLFKSHDLLNSFVDINNLLSILLLSFLLLFIITVLVEFLFCLFIFRKDENKNQKAIKASLIVNIVSYVVIIPLYLLVSGVSLVTKTDIDSSLSFVKNKDVKIIYVSNDNDVFEIDSLRRNSKKLFDAHVVEKNARVFLYPNDDGKTYDLYLAGQPERYKATLLKAQFIDRGLVGYQISTDDIDLERVNGSWFNFQVNDMRSETKKDWEIRTGFWSIEGISGENKESGEKFHIALETPFLSWIIRNVTILPNEQVIFQLGYNQIVIMDINTKKIGLITQGRGPLVLLNN